MPKNEIIKNALTAACVVCEKEYTDTLYEVWKMGLSDYSDEQVNDTIVDFCKNKENKFWVTPKEFMLYKKTKYPYL